MPPENEIDRLERERRLAERIARVVSEMLERELRQQFAEFERQIRDLLRLG